MSFEVGRNNGKSNADVLIEIVNQASPGEVLEYDSIATALHYGTERNYEKKDVQSIVSRSERKLAVNTSRALINVRNKGYKVALASEHQMIAGRKRERSNQLLKRGLCVLQNVDWDAMNENERKAHEGQLMVVSALHSAMEGIDSRLSRIEDAIKRAKG